MEAESVEVEDGEIIDNEPLDVFASYNILQRPPNIVKTEAPPVINYSDESDDTAEKGSDSDESDSDSKLKCKKQKVSMKRFRKKSHKSGEANNDKYKVWLTQAQEEILTQNLVTCGMNLYSDRNVESYDFMLRHGIKQGTMSGGKSSDEEKEKEVPRRFTNKRTHADRSNNKLRLETGLSQLGLGMNCEDRDERSVILDLSTTVDSTDDDVAEDITNKLGERKSELIKRVVDIAGKEKAIEFYEKTKKIEEEGGMLIMNGSRRRTPGGVYLFLVKNDRHIPRADIREIFNQDKKEQEKKRKATLIARRDKTQDLRRHLENNSNKDLPALLTRAELSTKQIAEEARLRRGEGMDRISVDSDRTVSNPPPSPVTDDPDHAEQPAQHGRQIQNYNDDILDLGLDADMDLF